jgi:hypothetical protein
VLQEISQPAVIAIYRLAISEAQRPQVTKRGASVTYVAQGKEVDGRPSLRYITLIRDGARAHSLPESYIQLLESVEHFSESLAEEQRDRLRE